MRVKRLAHFGVSLGKAVTFWENLEKIRLELVRKRCLELRLEDKSFRLVTVGIASSGLFEKLLTKK